MIVFFCWKESKNNLTNENEFDLYGPTTEDGVHYYGFGCSQHPTGSIIPDFIPERPDFIPNF